MTDINPNACYKCGALGHRARDCPNANSKPNRNACFTCHQPGHTAHECPQKHLNNPHFRVGDWVCPRCSNVNYARRAFCNNCSAAKHAAAGGEERVGFGGGFRENDNVEHKKHNSEDDEFDDFGRPKKAFRGRHVATTNIVGDPTPAPDKGGDDDDDDDDDGKYDAWGSDSEDAKKSRSPVARRRSRSRSRSPKRDSRQ